VAGGVFANAGQLESCTVIGNIAMARQGGNVGGAGSGGNGGVGGSGGSGVTQGNSGAAGAAGAAGVATGDFLIGFGSFGGVYTPTLNLRNSIVAGNHADPGQDADIPADTLDASSAFNVIGNDPMVGPLQDNGGPTPTKALLIGSPAVGAGDPALAGTPDQRGFMRLAPVDIGAFELNHVNFAPSFQGGLSSQQTTDEAGLVQVPGFVTSISAGPPDEATQTIDFIVTVDQPGLFTTAPSISPAGTLSFDPAPNVRGTAIVTIKIHDNGGTASGGVNISAAQTFNINVAKPHPWQNAAKHMDVTGDGHVFADDALEIINYLNAFGPKTLPSRAAITPSYYDVTGEDFVGPDDALDIINALNARLGGAGEAASRSATLTLPDFAATLELLAFDAAATAVSGRRLRP
jgi:hypothetical protein